MRLFLAIDINDQVRESIEKIQSKLKGDADFKKSDVKWVNPELIHLTVKFLGEVKDILLPEVFTLVQNVCANHGRFSLTIGGVGSFGGKSARVIWVGTEQGSDKLKELAGDIEEAFAQAGWKEENRDFAGHLTLCRVNNPRAGYQLAEKIKDFKDFKAGTIDVERVCVYQSDLTQDGPIYTLLASYELEK